MKALLIAVLALPAMITVRVGWPSDKAGTESPEATRQPPRPSNPTALKALSISSYPNEFAIISRLNEGGFSRLKSDCDELFNWRHQDPITMCFLHFTWRIYVVTMRVSF